MVLYNRGENKMNDMIHIAMIFDEMMTNLKYIKLATYQFKKRQK